MSGELRSGALPMGSARGGVDTRDMLEVHKVVRREFTLAPGLVRATGIGDNARVHTVADHLKLLISLLQVHHAEEDRQLWPKLLDRVPQRIAPIVSQMESQHQHIHQATESVLGGLPQWSTTAAAKERDELATMLDGLAAALTEHLDAEEQHILPLAAQHLTEQEWQQLGEEGLAGIPKKQLPLVFGMLMYQGNPEVIASILAHAPRLPRLLMPVLAPRVHAHYARRIHGTTTP